MAGRAQERDGLARAVRHRPDRNGSAAALTPGLTLDRGRATVQLLLGAALVLALALGRATAIQVGILDVVPAATFAGGLLAASLAVPSVRTALSGLPSPRSLTVGAAFGSALLVPGTWMRTRGVVGPGAVLPHGYALVWVPLIALISIGEETALRAWLQPLAREAWGPAAAILFAAAIFATMHAPVYGWIALPLDLGVAILIGCLRETTRSVGACALCHFVADLGHWWLP